jgi:hypothetical protein
MSTELKLLSSQFRFRYRGHERVEFYLHSRICLHAVLRNNFTSTFNEIKPGNQSINVKLRKRREKWQSSKATSNRVRCFGKKSRWNELYRHKALCHKPMFSNNSGIYVVQMAVTKTLRYQGSKWFFLGRLWSILLVLRYVLYHEAGRRIFLRTFANNWGD